MALTLRIFTEPQLGATYADQLAHAREAEALGFDAWCRSDHYLTMRGASGLPGPTDAWVTLAGLARETNRVRLGTMVSAATFRLPGPLAISVAQVDAMSGGRVELGLGAGWYEAEHTAYGVPFPAIGERFDRLEEQLAVVTGLWATPEGEWFSFTGDHYRLEGSPALPKPVQRPGPPVIVGGGGPKRTPRLAARFAQEFNTPFLDVDGFRAQRAVVAAACEDAGRDPQAMTWSASVVLCAGKDDAEFRRRATAIGQSPDGLRRSQAGGTPSEVVDRLGQFAEAGADRVYLQCVDMSDLDLLRLVAADIAPAVT